MSKPLPKLLSTDQVATLLNMTPKGVQTMRLERRGPPYIRVSHSRVLYDEAKVIAWLEHKTEAA